MSFPTNLLYVRAGQDFCLTGQMELDSTAHLDINLPDGTEDEQTCVLCIVM